mgnify:CR=1 FL=1
MENFEKFYRAALFSVCSAIGILAIALAAIGPEWKNYYKIKAAAVQSEKNNAKIAQLLADHDELIKLINTDPNILTRLAPIELGIEPNDPNTVAPVLTSDYLAQARVVVEQSFSDKITGEQIPSWLLRATLNSSRIVLFASGAGLMLVSFVCFSAPASNAHSPRRKDISH